LNGTLPAAATLLVSADEKLGPTRTPGMHAPGVRQKEADAAVGGSEHAGIQTAKKRKSGMNTNQVSFGLALSSMDEEFSFFFGFVSALRFRRLCQPCPAISIAFGSSGRTLA
jgi:hypothetical protein